MNVLMVTSDTNVLRDGSASQSALKERAGITNRLMVVVLNNGGEPSTARKVSNSLWVFPTNSRLPFLRYIDALYVVRHEIFFQNKLQADLIVGNDLQGAGLVACLLSSRYKKPLQLHSPNDLFSEEYMRLSIPHRVRSIIARFIIARGNGITVSHEKTRQALLAINPQFANSTTLIPDYVDVAAIQAEPIGEDLHVKYTQFRAILLAVAELMPEYNVQLAIQVLAEISKSYPDIGLVIVGDGPQKIFLQIEAKRLKVEGKVIFESPSSSLISYYKTAHVLLVTSLYEEYGNTIEEAAAAGCAIVSSRVAPAPDIIEHGKSGFLCDLRSPSEFWNAVDILIHNPTTRAEMRKNIAITMQQRFPPNHTQNLALYKSSWESTLRAFRGM